MAQAVGFFTDTTLCIGCKACEVACHQWNALPALHGGRKPLTGNSYDNTGRFSHVDWRHVKFIEQFSADRSQAAWLMMSDVCKHCVDAPCLDVCPTGAIIRTEFDTVYIREPVCNGCRDCIAACPFGVIAISPTKHVAQKCTFCYDRLRAGRPPACAQACPTASIQFGPIELLKAKATARLERLHAEGKTQARLYGADESVLGGLRSFYLLLDRPEAYGLPENPLVPSRSVWKSALAGLLNTVLVVIAALVAFRRRGPSAAHAGPTPPDQASGPGAVMPPSHPPQAAAATPAAPAGQRHATPNDPHPDS
jgi:formate dehydrogenase iron-sulfur subunit